MVTVTRNVRKIRWRKYGHIQIGSHRNKMWFGGGGGNALNMEGGKRTEYGGRKENALNMDCRRRG
jgi:hypothetical protein